MSSSSPRSDSSLSTDDPDGADATIFKHESTRTPGLRRTSSVKSGVRPSTSRDKRSKANDSIRKEYLELIDTSIQDPLHEFDDEPLLPASQIGASYWTSKEKDLLFKSLTRVGVGDLAAVSQAVGTKSEAEVHVYLQLLQQGLVELQTTLADKNASHDCDPPAAREVSLLCEDALDTMADAVELQSSIEDVKAAKARYRKLWLIDGRVAKRLDDAYEQALADDEQSTMGNIPTSETTDAVNDSQQQLSLEAGASQSVRKVDPSEDESQHVQSRATQLELFPSARLLRPTMFLRLSDAIFMNGPPGTGLNWTDYAHIGGPSKEPALFREAFEDFYDLVLVLTRRLIQTAIYQAMTRIRAMDMRYDRSPEKVVKARDVRIACDMLNLPNESSKSFWATAARRARVDVFSDSKKYLLGRPRTKNGVKLTFEEVEAELGLQASLAHTSGYHGADTDPLAGDEETTTSVASLNSYDSELHTSSAGSETVDECNAMESLDRHADQDHEKYLWDHVLGKVPPERGGESKFDLTDSSPRKHVRDHSTYDNWRERSTFVSEWEILPTPIQPEEFETMHRLYCRGRKRRKLHHTANIPESASELDNIHGNSRSSSGEDSESSRPSEHSSSHMSTDE